MPPKAKYQIDYKNNIIIPGVFIFGNTQSPDPQYGNLSAGLVISERTAKKFKDWMKPQLADWSAQNGGKKPQGATFKPSTNKDGSPSEGFVFVFKRKGEINGKPQRVTLFDEDGNPTDREPTPGSKVQVRASLYLSATATGVFVRAEPGAIRVVEYAEGSFGNDGNSFGEVDEDDFVSAPRDEDSPEGTSSDDEEDFL